MGKSEVKLLGAWPSPFMLRVRIALHLKSINYEFIEVDLLGPKSELVLKSNPIYKKIPVLFHDGNTILESQTILQYIDEVWPNAPSFLPSDAAQRADSRFWVAYFDDKLVPALIVALAAKSKDTKNAAIAELEQGLVHLEEVASTKLSKGKALFGGENLGYMDIALGPFLVWIGIIEKLNGVKLLNETNTPSLLRWADSFFSHAVVKTIFPEAEKLIEFAMKLIPVLRARPELRLLLGISD
ncbi:hypothetical protein E1A91_D08G032100v1 [Gossypium mustelinum]|uniref:Glutathione S-transferase n=1 Tax=Gossypium mustelinum TaxID=34275 RepID=A0A5D2TSC6_GOSMU|nr:hypothetical protein E1A91_D08G032100v1 [Gossypium mustelinum]